MGLDDDTGAAANLLCPAAHSPGGQPAYNDIFVEVLWRDDLVGTENFHSNTAILH